jgi:outer membrane protein assembly factor BamA
MKGAFACLWALTACAQQLPLEAIATEGTRYPPALVLKWSGLKIGQLADEAAIAGACKQLQETGLFKSAEYRYSFKPEKTGYDLIIHLQDEPQSINAEIDIPEVDDTAVWRWLEGDLSATGRRIPGNETALASYSRAIERYLAANGKKQEIATRMSGNLGSASSMTVLFQPKILPKIGWVKFEGVNEVRAAILVQRISPMALQSEYSRYRFKQLLEQNVRRFYEDYGFLKVAFKFKAEIVSSGWVAVTTVIDEGSAYRLARVDFDGSGMAAEELLQAGKFKIGELANWKGIVDSIAAMESPLRRDGYLKVQSRPERILHDDKGTLDLVVHVDKGAQYRFGSLRLAGLDPMAEKLAREQWRLSAGQPMNEEYPGEFLNALHELREFPRGKTSDTQMKKGAGDRIIDVSITFRASN